MSKKLIPLIIFIILIVAAGAIIYFRPGEERVLFENGSQRKNETINLETPKIEPLFTSTPQVSPEEKLSETITLMFVGDIMLSRSVEEKMKKENDWKWPFLRIADTLKEADILFGNLESAISDKGRNVGSIYSFRADPRAIEGLNFAGFDILSVANNHILDWGRDAMEDNFKRLKEAGISYVGGGFNEIESHTPIIKEIKIKGIKIAFLAYCSEGSEYWEAVADRSGIAWFDEEKLKKDIENAGTLADLVIVSMHFGEEYQQKPNSFQKSFARLAIDSGADLVVGHHPHVLQPIEEYKQGFIAYSLGNFIFDQTFSPQTKESTILKVVVEILSTSSPHQTSTSSVGTGQAGQVLSTNSGQAPSTSSGPDAKIKIVMPLKAEISSDFQVFLKQ